MILQGHREPQQRPLARRGGRGSGRERDRSGRCTGQASGPERAGRCLPRGPDSTDGRSPGARGQVFSISAVDDRGRGRSVVAGNAETHGAVAVRLRTHASHRGPQGARVVPGAPAHDAPATVSSGRPRAPIQRCPAEIYVGAVLSPGPDVPCRVIQPESIGLKAPHGRGEHIAVIATDRASTGMERRERRVRAVGVLALAVLGVSPDESAAVPARLMYSYSASVSRR
jgi:hypothetical protein